jgi:thiamine pyrophosphokinase
MRAIIVANGQVNEDEGYGHLVRPDDLIIAADGGASVAQQLGLVPQVVVGDMDSVPPELRAELEEGGCQFVDHPARKDETDTELAIQYALQRGAREILLLGATGDRLDHTLANVFLLGMPGLDAVPAKVVAANTEIWLLRDGGELEVHGQPGDIVTLLPLGQDAIGIESDGLEWALHDDTLHFGPARGVSNVMTADTARVALGEGLLLVFRVRTSMERRSDSMSEMTEQAETQDIPDLVEVYTEQGHLRANVIKSKLEAAGIPAMLSYDYASLAFGLTVDGIGKVRVMVREEHAEEARKLLAEAQSDSGNGNAD